MSRGAHVTLAPRSATFIQVAEVIATIFILVLVFDKPAAAAVNANAFESM